MVFLVCADCLSPPNLDKTSQSLRRPLLTFPFAPSWLSPPAQGEGEKGEGIPTRLQLFITMPYLSLSPLCFMLEAETDAC